MPLARTVQCSRVDVLFGVLFDGVFQSSSSATFLTDTFSFIFIRLIYSRWTSSLPSCLWSQRIFPSFPGSRLTIFYRDASSALLQLVTQETNIPSASCLCVTTYPALSWRVRTNSPSPWANSTNAFSIPTLDFTCNTGERRAAGQVS